MGKVKEPWILAAGLLVLIVSLPACIFMAVPGDRKDQDRFVSPEPVLQISSVGDLTFVERSYPAQVLTPEVTITVSLVPEKVPEARPIEPSFEEPLRNDVDDYLCHVYHRTSTKADRGGDFTWKDKAAAKRMNMDVCSYAISGMNRDFREQLYAAGQEMDKRGLQWSMLSGFRDDWRQGIASGIKARKGYSRHGGSRVTKGYGDGQAIDITGTPIGAILKFIDSTASTFGLYRPHKGFDPNHVQPSGGFQRIASNLRFERTGVWEKPAMVASKKPVAKKKYAKKSKKYRYAKRNRVRA